MGLMKYLRKLEGTPRHNPYALPIMLQRVEEVVEDIQAGAPIRAAVCAGFTGRALAHALRGLGLPKATRDELLGVGTSFTYQKVTTRK